MKRSGKFYRKNEAEVMEQLGLKPTVNSGSGWIEKEDGISDDLICQLKSTDASSIKIEKLDIDKLFCNASVAHKLPVFAIQFLQTNQVFLLVTPDNISDIAHYLDTGENKRHYDDLVAVEEIKQKSIKKIKSSKTAREHFAEEANRKFKKERRSAT